MKILSLKNRIQNFKGLSILITLLIGVLFFVLNYFTPLYADDYTYSFSFSTWERITSVSQIPNSQIAHYSSTNGRIVTHSLAQLFLLAGDGVFNIINTIAYLFLIYLIYYHACGTLKKISVFRLSIIAMLLFLSCPAFGQSFLWITGAANYLYGILIILCFLSPYRRQATNRQDSTSLIYEIFMAVLFFAFCVIAGWTNENNAVAMIAMVVGYIIYFRIKSIRIHAWNITGCLGGIIGCIFMLSSPGTGKRLESAGGGGGVIAWIKRTVFYTCSMGDILQLALLIFCTLIVIYIYQKKVVFQKQCRKNLFSFCKNVTLSQYICWDF